MSTIRPSVDVITLFEPDLDEAKEFYGRVFDKQPDFADDQTANYHFDNLIINLERESGSAEQIGELPVAPQSAGSRVVISTFVEECRRGLRRTQESRSRRNQGPGKHSVGNPAGDI